MIDENLCKKEGLRLPQLLLGLSVKLSKDYEGLMEEMLERKMLLHDGEKLTVSEHWGNVMEELMSQATTTMDLDEWYLDLAERFSKKFPQGKMPGTAYYYRGNKKELIQKFKKFFEAHKEYGITEETKEKILDAAERYNMEMGKTPKYRQLAKYFISKVKTVPDEDGSYHNEEISELASYLENKESENEIPSENWFLTARN